ncbi:hypothetical protein HZC35_03400 [Candidatus Saganbacteria bacterium]|nr:hypothetical protein [Candidatus Saganbacteria bacterium]
MKYTILNPTLTRTTRRTAAYALENLFRIARGQMGAGEALRRTQQSAVAFTRGELTIRQATNQYLESAKVRRGIDRDTLDYLIEHCFLYEQKRDLFESILFGGYEARLAADTDLRAIANRTEIDAPAWKIELLKDLFDGVISKSDWNLISRLTTINQGEAVFGDWTAGKADLPQKQGLLKQLRELDDFIGIEEYSQRVNLLIDTAEGKIAPPVLKSLQAPPVTEVSDVKPEDIPLIKKALLTALSRLDEVVFAAVVGGAAERLKYMDAEGRPLPQATYPFLPLSRRNIFGLHADSILAIKNLFYLTQAAAERGVQIPYFMMTSHLTDTRIAEDFEAHGYYGLGRKNVSRVSQPLIPVVSAEGKWLRKGPYELNTKPHGHGDFWRLYFSSAAQAELAEDLKRFTLVLQGNNPFLFAHLLEFAGLGMMRNAAFGFSTSPRRAGAPEGSVVLAQNGDGSFSIRNIEYPVLNSFGIRDDADPNTGYSRNPNNLNFLFADSSRIRPIIERDPFPGEIINLGKMQTSHADHKEVRGGRGEAQMQGLAEVITASRPEELPVFVMNGQRGSHPSSHFDVFKNEPEKPVDTVATCRQNYSDRAAAWLLSAGVKVEHRLKPDLGGKEFPSTESVIELTPAFSLREDLLRSKVRGGRVAEGSTLYLSGFHAEVRNLDLSGDLQVVVENEIGDSRLAADNQGAIIPDPGRAGKVRIHNLAVRNAGRKKVLDRNKNWQGEFEEKEHCRIVIKGNGELFVEPGTVIDGNFDLTVNDGEKVTLAPLPSGGFKTLREKITAPSWRFQVELNLKEDTLDLFELKSDPAFIAPLSVAAYSLEHPEQVIDIEHLLQVPGLVAGLDPQHQHEVAILRRAFKNVLGSLVYDIEERPEGGKRHPYLRVRKGSKRGIAVHYPSRADDQIVRATDHKSGIFIETNDGLKIFIDKIDESKGAAFSGKYYVAIPNRGANEIIMLIGEFDESFDGINREEAFGFKLKSLYKFAADPNVTITPAILGEIRQKFHAITWADFFILPIGEIFQRYIKPKPRIT